MSVLYQSQPIQSSDYNGVLIVAAWEMTKFALSGKPGLSSDQIREEFTKNYHAIWNVKDSKPKE